MDVNKAIDSLATPGAFVLGILIFLLLFHRPIAALIDRIRRLGFGDKAIDLADVAQPAQQLQKLAAKQEVPPPAQHGPPPPASAAVALIETDVLATMKSANLTPENERAWLVRSVATVRLW